MTVTLRAGQDVWTNMGAGSAEYMDAVTRRTLVDLSELDLVRFVLGVHVAGAAAATLKVQYTADLTGVAGWADLTATLALNPTGMKFTTAAAIPEAAKTVVLLRLVGVSGDGVADPLITYAGLYLSQE